MRRHASAVAAFSFGCLFMASGCTSNLQSIDGRVFFSVFEGYQNDYSEGTPRILLEMRTEKIYGCCNNRIVSEITRSGSYIMVHLKGILFPEICLTALGPAASRDFLDLPEGVYSLNFLQWSSPDKYTLTVRKDAIEIVPGLTIYTAPENTIFWRYPENSFAYYCGTMTKTAWVCDDFLAPLSREVELEEFQFPAYGEICYPPSGQGHWYNASARYFKYKREEDFDKAGELLKTYSEQVISKYQGTDIYIVNWKNKHYPRP
ncbi:MAG: hypothetical protein WAU81_15310 [Candidatus Aminicenantales bacterium]